MNDIDKMILESELKRIYERIDSIKPRWNELLLIAIAAESIKIDYISNSEMLELNNINNTMEVLMKRAKKIRELLTEKE